MPVQISDKIRRVVQSSRVDSELYASAVSPDRHADLILRVNVWFHRVDTGFVTDALTGQHVPVLPWGSNDNFLDWVFRCRQAMERGFENKFWLVPDNNWGVRYVTGSGHYRPSIKCSLRIRPVSAHERRHLHIDCYRVTPDFCPRVPGDFAGSRLYRSYMSPSQNYGRLVNVDAWTCRTYETEVHYQDVAAHEMGHVIGLGHVAQQSPQCIAAPNSNDDVCYGLNPYQRDDLMGYGNRVERWHAGPWRKRLPAHVRVKLQWALQSNRPSPAFVVWGQGPSRPAPSSGMDGGVPMDAGLSDGPADSGPAGGTYWQPGGLDGGVPSPDGAFDGG